MSLMELNSAHNMAVAEYLPDELIEHIFSLMRSPKDLIRTSLIAKRWRYFWAFARTTSLEFNDVKVGPSIIFFIRFFRTIKSVSIIQRLSIQLPNTWSDPLRNPISLVLSHCVQEVCISPAYNIVDDLSVPISVFSASNLKTLTLHNLWYNVEGGDEFVVTCPDLESLILKGCRLGKLGTLLALRTPKLNKLEINNLFQFEILLKLHTPKLSTFSFTNAHGSALVCKFGDLDIYKPAFNKMHLWFKHSCHFSKTCRHGLPIDAASHAQVSANGNYKVLENMTIALGKLLKLYGKLRSLELTASFELPENIDRFASLLMSNCSSIELLIFKVVSRPKSRKNVYDESVELPVPCMLNKLKYIAVQVESLDYELELFRFLLRSAVNLQRMAIAWKHSKHQIEAFEQFRGKLSQEYPRVHFLFQLS